MQTFSRLALGAAFATLIALPTFAQDKLKVAVGQRGVWENSVS